MFIANAIENKTDFGLAAMRKGRGAVRLSNLSCPPLGRVSTPLRLGDVLKSWMAGTSPAMTAWLQRTAPGPNKNGGALAPPFPFLA